MFRRIHRIQSNRSNLPAKLPLLQIYRLAFCYAVRLMKAYFSLAHNKFYVTQSIHPLQFNSINLLVFLCSVFRRPPLVFFLSLHFPLSLPFLFNFSFLPHLSKFSFLALSVWISFPLYRFCTSILSSFPLFSSTFTPLSLSLSLSLSF